MLRHPSFSTTARSARCCLALLTACGGAARPTEGSPSPRSRTAPFLEPQAFSDIRAEVDPIDESDALPAALGIPILRTSSLANGDREIRVWSGLVAGYPHNGLVLHVHNQSIVGQLVRYWPVNDTAFDVKPGTGEDPLNLEVLYAYYETGRCASVRRGPEALACIVQLRSGPDWRAALAELDRVNAWTLADESALSRHANMFDGWRVRVEARDGATYRRYQYSNPGYIPLPEGQRALGIELLVDSLMQYYARPPEALQYFRGHFSYGRDTSDFVSCAGGEALYMRGNPREFTRAAGDSSWHNVGTTAHQFYVEGWGTLRLPHHERVGRRVYARAWSVDSVFVMRAPSPDDCR